MSWTMTRVDAAIDRFAEEGKRFHHLGGLDEDVEGEVDATPSLVGDPARLAELVQA